MELQEKHNQQVQELQDEGKGGRKKRGHRD